MTEKNPPPLFVADTPALDFLNSVATPIDTQVDWVADGEGLILWLEQAGLVPDDVLQDMRKRTPPGILDDVAAQARSLREWFRDFVRKHMGHPLTARALAELAPLNRLLERDESYRRITGHGKSPLELQTVRRWRTADALLLPIAEAMAETICTENFAHVRACEGAACTLVFADHTRGRARRWCSMAICGNRAKQAAHRHRRKA